MNNSWQKDKQIRATRNKVLEERKAKVKKSQIKKSLKKYLLVGVLGLGLGGSVTKDIVDFVGHNAEISKTYEPYKQIARDIINRNSTNRENKQTGNRQTEYNHFAIAKEIELFAKANSELKGDALISAVINETKDNAYNNDDRIIKALSDEFTTYTTKEDYIHSLGYETEEEYLKGIKEELVDAKEKEEVINKYFDGGIKR